MIQIRLGTKARSTQEGISRKDVVRNNPDTSTSCHEIKKKKKREEKLAKRQQRRKRNAREKKKKKEQMLSNEEKRRANK